MSHQFVKLALACCLTAMGGVGTTVYAQTSGATQTAEACTGTVIDSTGEPVIGASVLVIGTNLGAATDIDGNFSIRGIKPGAKIKIAGVGYKPQEVVWQGTPLNVTLEDNATALDEVVVTALGIKKDAKRVGYAISTVKADALTSTAAPTLGSALNGKAAGVNVSTAPGGATGSISINVRGLNSITGSNQPLIVVNGVPVRNGDANGDGYWGNQRVQSNGLADINPEDIESLSILKGASATALYGSEGANGVVLITTKNGQGAAGTKVEFSASVTGDWVAYMPKYQTKYGSGYNVMSRYGNANVTDDGFYNRADNRNGNGEKRLTSAYSTQYWGPKYDGRDVWYYDNTVRKYEPITDNPWSDVYRTGFDQQYNLSIVQGGEKGDMRFAYTYLDNLPTQYNSHFRKHNFMVTGNYKVLDNFNIAYSANYILSNVQNRPYRMSRLVTNFGGMFGTFDDINYLRTHTVTKAGYQNRVWSSAQHENPEEGWTWTPPCSALVDEYFWNIMGKMQAEHNNRLLASVTPSWNIIKGLTLQTRFATDYTTENIKLKEKTSTNMAMNNGNAGGYFSMSNNRYEIYYFDAMLMFDRQLTEKLGLTANVGWQARKEKTNNTSVSTNGGLTVENWFHLNASKNKTNASMYTSDFLKTALLGTASLSWDTWGFLEGTVRQEKISTLAPGNNSFFYPSINGSLVFSEMMGSNRPTWFDYGKVRVSYGVVGNAPAIYAATQAYNQSSIGGYVYNQLPTNVGNNLIEPEKKYEWEFGLEGKFFQNRAGFEVSYYTNRVKDQILSTTMPSSSGGKSILMNIGELKNSGLELAVYGSPIRTRDWDLELRANISFNHNEVSKLKEGVDYIEHSNYDNGSMYLRSYVGQSMGDFYSYAPAKDAQGRNIITDAGYYKLTSEPVKVGNAMPKAIGGFGATLHWKDLFLMANLDFRIGGHVFNMPYQYMMGQGGIEESLWAHDGEPGMLKYYVAKNAEGVNTRYQYDGATGPNGETIHTNGIILEGVHEDGTPNETLIPADQYLYWTYNWGGYDPQSETYYSHSLFKNSYVKFRELTLGYNLPKAFTSKFKCTGMQVSVYGRNLFYLYKNMPIFDAEATDATNWIGQACIGGSSATTRSFGVQLRMSF